MPVIRLQGEAERQAGIYYEVNTDEPALGAGGMGQVYRGVRVDTRTGQTTPVAIKFLFDDLPENAIERSRREASIRISNENLVEMYGFIEIPDPQTGVTHYHVVSELLQGVMLYDLLEGKTTDREGNPVPFAVELYDLYRQNRTAFAARIIKAVLSGVMAMHDMGYIHRDIDPSNIMITVNGRIKLIDFGIAKKIGATTETEHHLTSVGQFMGKASYAAPEQICGDVAHQNETTDIYSIGIMLFQLLTGHLPFDGAQHEVADMQLHSELPLADIADENMRNVVSHATRKRQGERYMSAAEFRVEIERAERGRKTDPGTVLVSPPTTGNGNGGGRSHKGLIIGLCVGVGVLAIGAIALFVIGLMGKEVQAEENDETYITEIVDGHRQVTLESGSQYILPENGDIIDSMNDDEVVVDGKTYRTMGRVISDAMSKLDSGDARGCIEDLEKACNSGLGTGALAALKLADIYRRDNLSQNQWDAVDNYVTDSTGNRTAVKYVRMASELNSNSSAVLLAMAELYYGGAGYTDGLVERDMDRAIEYYRRALSAADAENNYEVTGKVNARLEQIQALGIPVEHETTVEVVDSLID